MSERDPRLKQCPKCDNWVGKSNVVGSCADCMNSKGFSVPVTVEFQVAPPVGMVKKLHKFSVVE